MGDQTRATSVTFSPDGTTLAASDGRTLRLWDAASGVPIGQSLMYAGMHFERVAFSSDGKTLATVVAGDTRENQVVIWDMSTDSWHARACGIANRNFTCTEWQRYFDDIPYKPICPHLQVPEDCVQ